VETIQLPKNSDDVVDAITKMRKAAWSQRSSYLTWCQIAFYYLRGYRRFRVTNLDEARVMIGYEDKLGDLNFRNEDIRQKFKTELGRFLRMNLEPSVEKKSWGLDAIRRASMAKIVLDRAISRIPMKRLQTEFLQHLLTYGVAAVGHWQKDNKEDGLDVEFEIVPSWELMPAPAYPVSESAQRGLIRYRKVPLKWLREKADRLTEGALTLPTKKNPQYRSILEVENVQYGDQPSIEGLRSGGFSEIMFNEGANEPNTRSTGIRQNENIEEFVPLTEAWIFSDNWQVVEYVVVVGKHLAMRIQFDEPVPCPIGIARQTPDSGFYTYGFVGMMMTGNHQSEKMLRNLYSNVENLDAYGVVLWPNTAGAGKKEFDRKNGKPKIVSYEIDYTVPEQKPFALEPANTGDLPGRIAHMAMQLQDKLSGQGPLFSGDAPGRVDSGSGLGFAFEVNQISQAATAHQIAEAWVQVYRSVLYTSRHVLDAQSVLEVSTVDDNVIGLKVSKEGRVALDDNPVPHWYEVNLDIMDRQPKSVEQRKQELVGMLQMGIIDPLEFRLINYREDLGFPVGNRAEFESFRTAVYNNIVVFGDGETPGEAKFDLATENPEIHLRAVLAFTARLEFRFASKEVRAAFADHVKMLKRALGAIPPQMPDMLQMAETGGMPPGAMPGGGMPMGGMMGG